MKTSHKLHEAGENFSQKYPNWQLLTDYYYESKTEAAALNITARKCDLAEDDV